MRKKPKTHLYLIISSVITILLFLCVFLFRSEWFLLPLLLPLGLLVLLFINVLLFYFPGKQSKAEKVEPEQEPQVQITLEKKDRLKYEAILAYIGEGLIVIDKSGKIITFNKAAESLLGYKEDEVLGHELTEVIKIDYQTSVEESKLSPSRQSSLYFIRKDKTKFPAAITTTSYGIDTNILGTATLFRDVTMEQNIDKMKNEFISLASHQLRTPLAAIKWYTEMLLKGDAGKLLPEQEEFANTIYTSTERMIDLVNLLLNISRIESGRITVEPMPTDMKKLVNEVVQEVKIRYKDKNQTITASYHEPLPIINIDPRLVRQVYINLLTNACKYTPEKGEITIELSKNKTDIVSKIADNGYGIPDEDQDKLFGKYFRGLKTVTRTNQGTGLGLYLVKDIVDLSRGKIWFESKVDKGTTFWVTLPLSGTPAKKGVLTFEA